MKRRYVTESHSPWRVLRDGLILVALITGATAGGAEIRPTRLFSAFDNGLTDLATPEAKATLLRDLGYDGICTRPATATRELLDAMDRNGLQILATYVTIRPTNGQPAIPADVAEHIKSLRGRKTIVWLGLAKAGAATSDAQALTVLREVADLAAANGLDVALYPHVGCITDTVSSCLRLLEKAARPNLGLSFTLCHYLAQNDQADLEKTLRLAGPHLKLVQINGADQPDQPPAKPDWAALIKPLGQGSFDMERVLGTLDEIGYAGPLNLQCYQVRGPAQDHLRVSMKAWRDLHMAP